MGISNKDRINTANIFMEATKPNWRKSLLEVSINVAKPNAVVVFVRMVIFPTRLIIWTNDLDLLPCSLNSLWYLLIRKIQLGTPMTIKSGGIKAVRMVIS